MVLKSEIITSIQVNFPYSTTPQQVNEEQYGASTKRTYQVQACRTSGLTASVCFFCIYVFEEGTANEAAYIEASQIPEELISV